MRKQDHFVHVWWLKPSHFSADEEVLRAGCVERGEQLMLRDKGSWSHTKEVARSIIAGWS